MTKQQSESNRNLRLIYRTAVTGLSHHDYALVAQQIDVGTELEMEAIDCNSFDTEAVKISFDGQQIGWLSAERYLKAAKGIIWRMLKNDVEIRVKVISHDLANGALDKRLYIGLFLRII